MPALVDHGTRLVLAGLALMAGSALQLQQAVLWPAAAYAGLAGGGVLLLVLALAPALAAALAPARAGALAPPLAAALPPAAGRHGAVPRGARLRAVARAAPLVLAMLLLGLGGTGWRAAERLAEALPPALEGQDIELTGTVAGLPRSSLSGTRFVFEVEQALHGGVPVDIPRRLSLGWSRGFDGEALLAGPGVEIRAGQRWRFTVRLKAPHGPLNPHGFDLELWLFEQGIRASGQVRAVPAAPAVKLAEAAAHPVQRLRQRVRDAIDARVPDTAAAGVLAALALGDQAAIERADWEVFRDTGVAHLMAISGLHVTMFAWLAGALIGRLWRLSAPLMLRWPAPHAARWGGLACAAAYAVFAGWGVPAQRTVWMIAAVVLLRTLAVRWPPLLVLLAAGVAVTAIDPWALLQPGFWLSFVAVGLLMVAAPDDAPAPGATRWWRLAALLRGGLRTQAVATVGLAPLTLLFFQQLSLVGFAANLLAIPLVTLLITPLALLGALVPPLWTLGAWAVQGLSTVLAWLAGWPLAVWTAAAAPAWAAAAGLLGAALLVLRLPWRLRALGLPLLLPLLWPAPPRPAPGQFEAVAADIGQGTAVLVRTRHHLLLYDSGPAWGPESDAGERVLLPLLRARGERRIDTLVLSHRDSDHVGGAASLLARLPVGQMISSLEPAHPLRAAAVPQQRCEAGQSWVWDGVHFEMLHPPAGDHTLALKANALSCVLRVRAAGGRSLLLSGDIEADQEAALLERQRARLPSEVLLVPHHGSRTSSTAGFVDAVAPRVALVQAGYRGRFGHPAPEVVARYRARGTLVVRSDECGAWTLSGDGATHCERQRRARYWHHRPH